MDKLYHSGTAAGGLQALKRPLMHSVMRALETLALMPATGTWQGSACAQQQCIPAARLSHSAWQQCYMVG
jgi:hypothetical protein